jgi:tRNA1(Val) A37 N6-methylase TrmN6
MLEILKKLNAEVKVKPILSFRNNSKPKNVLIMFKNNNFYKEKKLKNLIIHTKTSRYSKKIQSWFK